MALIADAKSSGFSPFEAGTYQAVCYTVIDLGTQYSEYYKDQHKVWIAFEIPKLRCMVEKDSVEKDMPRVVSKFYTLSIHEKSNLGIHLVGWRGRVFTAEEASGFNVMELVGKNCLLNIGIKGKTGTEGRNEINSIAGLMEGMKKLVPETPICQYSMTADGWNFPENMPQGIQKIVEKSMEFKASHATAENKAFRAAQAKAFSDPAKQADAPPAEDTTDFGPNDPNIPW